MRRNLEVASCSRDTRVLANLGFGFSREREKRVDEVLELIGLTEEAGTIAANLSHGQTQWLELGMLDGAGCRRCSCWTSRPPA